MAQKVLPPTPPITIQHGLASATGNVVMMFSQKVDLLVLTPEHAALVAVRILEGVRESKPSCVEGFTWPPQPMMEKARG